MTEQDQKEQKIHFDERQVLSGNDHRGMWLIWFDDPTARSKAWTMLLKASEEKSLSIWRKDITEDKEAIGCITENDEDVVDIYTKGKEIRQILGPLSRGASMYYKSKEAILKKLSSHAGDWYICNYTLLPCGTFQERRPHHSPNWVNVKIEVKEVKKEPSEDVGKHSPTQ